MSEEEAPTVRTLSWQRVEASPDVPFSGYQCQVVAHWRGQNWADAAILHDEDIEANRSSPEALRDLVEAQMECALLSLADSMGYDRAPLACLIPPSPNLS
jgi:hypothetical protein